MMFDREPTYGNSEREKRQEEIIDAAQDIFGTILIEMTTGKREQSPQFHELVAMVQRGVVAPREGETDPDFALNQITLFPREAIEEVLKERYGIIDNISLTAYLGKLRREESPVQE